MRSVESEGESIDAAIEAALKTLGVERDRVEVQILSSASRGLFGIGSRKAKVRATLRASIVDQVLEEAAAPPPPQRREEPKERSTEPAERRTEPNRPRRPRPERPQARAASRPRPAPEPRPSREPVDSAAAQRAEEALREIVRHMGVSAEVHGRADGDAIVLDLTGDASGVLIGRKGQMLDALEYLVSRIVSRDQASAVRVVIDCERYRERRREALEDMARRMADEAKRKKRVVKLNAMSPRDRRIVHLVLQMDSAITTRSSGTGHFRKLIIIPRNGHAADDSATETE